MAPKILAYVDKHGRPLACVALQLIFALLAFINEAPGVGNQFFNWLLALSGVQNFFTWGSICLAHIRFRQAWAKQGHTVDELPFAAIGGIWGSYFGLFLNVICLVAQFYIAAFPIGEAELTPTDRVKGFFSSFLAAPLILFFYLVWKIYSATSKDPRINHRGWKPYIKLSEIDVDHGIREGILKTPDEVASIKAKRDARTTKDKILAGPLSIWYNLFKP
jgi:amino acid transporter